MCVVGIVIYNVLTNHVALLGWLQDEKDQAINSVRKEVKEKGIVDTSDNCWQVRMPQQPARRTGHASLYCSDDKHDPFPILG